MASERTATKHAKAVLETMAEVDRIEYARASKWGRTDLFGVFDAIAITRGGELLLAQWTGGSPSNASQRRAKITLWARCGACAPHSRIEVWQWVPLRHFRRWRWSGEAWEAIEPLPSPLLAGRAPL